MSKRFILSIVFLFLVFTAVLGLSAGGEQATVEAAGTCGRTITANVVALDQPFYYNRLGAINANGMIYALARDVVSTVAVDSDPAGTSLRDLDLTQQSVRDALKGNVALREDKRPRPIVLRMNGRDEIAGILGDCLQINFTNLLDPDRLFFELPPEFPPVPPETDPAANQVIDNQPFTRDASIHVDGLQLVNSIGDDGSFVGTNDSSIVAPGDSATYTYYAENEATHLLYSMGTTVGGEGVGGTRGFGLFGAVNVQRAGSVWQRSQLTRAEMDMATQGYPGPLTLTAQGHPVLNYNATYPIDPLDPNYDPGKAGLPIINMLDGTELVHSDINAIISDWTTPYPANDAYPDREDPFREFTVIFHDEVFAVQAFPSFYKDPVLGHTLHGVRDAFPINYGSGGIGSEIIANRIGVGPMWDCAECKYEEFFLTSNTVGDPAMIVDIPANADLDGDGVIDPGAKATKALFPDDPSNVHHAYLGDNVKFRNLHAGPKEHHIFHLHAHQWLFTPDDPHSNYLDGQAIGPGSGYTYEIAYGGSGNRNLTPGDSIFHCHFYPHFAMGMWELWRTHDTFERGTVLDANGRPTVDPDTGKVRALPDGEIVAGTPIPGLVPMPDIAMAPMPDDAANIVASDLNPNVFTNQDGDPNNGNESPFDSSQFDADGNGTADVFEDFVNTPAANPGYPFYIPGLMGHRPPTPALDMDPAADGWDGGLPRHVVTSGPDEFVGAVEQYQTRLDFNKTLHAAAAVEIPEAGTPAEVVAQEFHAGLADGGGDQFYNTFLPNGDPANDNSGFEVNGRPAIAGAPFADPCRADGGGPLPADTEYRTIKGANIEMDITLNKVGWHFQQQRFEALWEDVFPTLTGAKAPEPLVMRLNSTDCAEFQHTNLVPNVYQLDDYQVRTPTDIIGQHIHLVKFDVTSADGAANGFNYEDGTLSPDEVVERIHAFNAGTGAGLEAEHHPFFSDLANTPNYWCEYVNDTVDPAVHQFVQCTDPGAVIPAAPFKLEKAGPDFDGDTHPDQNWLGARTTIQRWYADPLLERSWDGGVGTVFTHDHYGPSTHQQVGLYSTLLVEPEDSTWRDPETNACLGFPGDPASAGCDPAQALARDDGGPTSWRADIILPGDLAKYSHREFYFEFADFQHAYEANTGALGTLPNGALDEQGNPIMIPSYADFAGAINPSFRQAPANPADIFLHPNGCPGPALGQIGLPRPCPEAISADDPGTYVLNFRNEPIGLRVFNGVLGAGAGQTPGDPGDLALAFQSRTDRAIAALNSQPNFYPPLTLGVQPGDPWTPLMRVYAGDKVRIRTQVGAHEEEHNFTVHGLKWLHEGNSPTSGFRNHDFGGIDEYFNLDIPVVADVQQPGNPRSVDYMYTAGADVEGTWNGIWGILRSYQSLRENGDLLTLPNNPIPGRITGGGPPRSGWQIVNEADFNETCPLSAPLKFFRVTAARAEDLLGPQGLVYNTRATQLAAPPAVGGIQGQGPLIDPTAILYVLNDDMVDPANPAAGLKPGVPVEPLILRANAGDCVEVELHNALPAQPVLAADGVTQIGITGQLEMPGFNSLPPIIHKDENAAGAAAGVPNGITTFNANDVLPSSYVGLHPQLLEYNVRTSDGFVTGSHDPASTLVPPGASLRYTWYAGDLSMVRAADNVSPLPNGCDPDNNGGLAADEMCIVATPVEFGATNLIPADRVKGSENGMVGALIIEPQGATWQIDPGTRAQAMVTKIISGTVTTPDPSGTTLTDSAATFLTSGVQAGMIVLNTTDGSQGIILSVDSETQLTLDDPGLQGGTDNTFVVDDIYEIILPQFREFVTIMQNDINLRYGGGVCDPDPITNPSTQIATIACALPNVKAEEGGVPEDPQDSGQKAINYGAEPLWFRLGIAPDTPFGAISRDQNLADPIREVFSNGLVGGDPQTPVYLASPNGPQEARFRVVQPGGHARGTTYTLHGHEWEREPYAGVVTLPNGDQIPTEIGENPTAEYYGTQEGINPFAHYDFVVDPGGSFDVTGDYLWRDQASLGNFQGLWGLFRYDSAAPVAVDDAYSVRIRNRDIDLVVDAANGVLANDSNLTSGAMTAALDSGPTLVSGPGPVGPLTLNQDGSFTYTALQGSKGTVVSFTYTATNSDGTSNVATVTITVQ